MIVQVEVEEFGEERLVVSASCVPERTGEYLSTSTSRHNIAR
jgi:hypothetical protein